MPYRIELKKRDGVIFMQNVQIGESIKQARTKRGYSQEVLSEKANISPAFLSQMETDVRKPSIETLISIADILNVSIDELVYGFRESKATAIFASLIDGKSELEIRLIMDTVEFLASQIAGYTEELRR